MPGFKYNLISVSALTLNSSLVVLFSDDGFLIQDINNKKMISKGRRWNDLYLYQVDASLVSIVMNKASAHVWHERLGHPSMQKLRSLKTILDLSECSSAKPCFVCPLAKQKRLQFLPHNNLADKPFDIVYCDI